MISKINLPDLVNLQDWQRIQDSFAEVLGIPIKTTDTKGLLMTKISNPLAINENLLYSSGLNVLSTEAIPSPDEKLNMTCPFGFCISRIPIRAYSNRIAAEIFLGPYFIDTARDVKKIAAVIKGQVEINGLEDELEKIPSLTEKRVQSSVTLLKNTFTYITQAGYQKKRLGEIAPEVMALDPVFMKYYEEKVFDAFLKTCMMALDADSGSIMTVDKNTDTLHIKVAATLDQDIVDKTEVKMGEGLSGYVAATAMPLVLPKDENRRGVADMMKRKYIKSALVIPFSKGNFHDVYGVLNLNIVRKNREFTDQDISFVKELTNLASIALIPVK